MERAVRGGGLTSRRAAAAAGVAALTAAVLVGMWRLGTGSLLRPPPAPIQRLAFERVVFRPGEIVAQVRNTGPDPITIAQVLVDDAYWQFTAEPSKRLGRLQRATLRIPYPWVAGEPVEVGVLDSAGLTFSHEVEVAAETPPADARTAAGYVLLGAYAGLVPVLLGLAFVGPLRGVGTRTMRFLLGLTGGLLVFLAVDALAEAVELASGLDSVFQGSALVLGGVAVAWVGLASVGRRFGASGEGRSPLGLAYLIAAGIGLHNLGEGLAIGAAQAVGEVALGTFLVIGFALHNLTEGIGIVAPTLRSPPRLAHLLALGAVAGLPTIAGTLAGGFAFSPLWATLFFAVGAGAIVQVVVELGRVARDRTGRLTGPAVGGAAAGFALMYATGLLIKA